MESNVEIRSFNINSDVESRLVSGYALVFNSVSTVLYDKVRRTTFREMVMPTSLSQDIIDRSDVVMNYSHDDNMILARSKYGQGTLSLRLDDHGLFFEFEMPQTALGDQVLESIRRGDVSTCSFKCVIGKDTWTRDEEGNPFRTIDSITDILDCAIVIHAAYNDTEVCARSLEKINELIHMTEKDLTIRAAEEEEEKTPQEEQQEQEEKSCENEEERSDEETEETEEKEDTPDEESEEKEDTPDEEDKEDEEQEDTEEKNTKRNKESKAMEKRFSLLRAISQVAKGQKLDGAEAAVSARGAEVMVNAGQEFNGQIQLPVAEMRADDPVHYTVNADGEHVVVTDYLNILEPLRAKNVLVQAGAQYITGLKGDLQLPIASDVNVYFEDEIADAQNGAGSFSSIKFAPRRMTAEIPISKQFIIQDTLGAENMIRNLLVTKINNKLEEVILSEAAASGAKPAGIFYNVSPTEVSDYAGVCELESDIADNNIDGPLKYIVSPKAKAALRSMIKGTNATGMVFEYDEVDGKPAYETTHMTTGKFAVGDWSTLYIAQWGGIDLTVDPYTWSGKGMIRLVVNAFFDFKVVRDGAIVYGEIGE